MKPGPKKDPTEFQPDMLGEIPYTIARYAFWGGLVALVTTTGRQQRRCSNGDKKQGSTGLDESVCHLF